MRLMTLFATAAVLAAAAPAAAQETSPAPAPATIPAVSAEEQALQASGVEFEANLRRMIEELQGARIVAGADVARAEAEADTIVARYQPQADALADRLAAYAAAPGSGLAAERQAEVAVGVAAIRAVPGRVRVQVMAAPMPAVAPAPQ